MTSSKGNKVANQFIVNDATIKHVSPNGTDNFLTGTMFQSYNSNIVFIPAPAFGKEVLLDRTYWDYSVTTGKYRNMFLGETKAETQKKIDNGEYILTDLNG